MNIFARGEKIRIQELQQKLASVAINCTIDETNQFDNGKLHEFDIIFDLNFDEHKQHLHAYAQLTNKPVIVSAAKQSLVQAAQGIAVHCHLIGINALPTFIHKPIAEVSALNSGSKAALENIFNKLEWNYKLVSDRVGLVTPRIIFMIINEAYYTVQEGTATIADIDTSMKLGTNYPHGPFEWAKAIGITHVYQTLEAVYNDTHDERYKICPLLKTEYLAQ
jgi:3-hydroxybutyryl-CoA dehydrogenase